MARMIYSNQFHAVQVQQDKDLGVTTVLVDGNPIKHVKSIEFKQSAVETPMVTFEINALPEIDTDALVEFKFSPDSYTDAVKLLIAGAKADNKIRDGLYHSIMSAINDLDNPVIKANRFSISEAVTKRLLNED